MVVLPLILFSMCFFSETRTAVLPVEKCKPNDSTCLVSSFQKAVPIFMSGIPELGVEVLDVMEMDDTAFDLAGFQFSLRQGRLKGMKGAIVDSVKWLEKKKKLALEFHVNCTIRGSYTAGGRILILPISGDGQVTMKLKNVAVKYLLDYDMEERDGKHYLVPKKYNFEFEVKDNAHFTLTNLFNGNKELSDSMHLFLNENWQQISAEFGKPIMGAAASKIYKNIVSYFQKEAIEDITAP